VTANVLSPGVAAAIPIKSCHRFDRADIKGLAEHVSGGAPLTTSVAPIVPQHCRLSFRGESLQQRRTPSFTPRRFPATSAAMVRRIALI